LRKKSFERPIDSQKCPFTSDENMKGTFKNPQDSHADFKGAFENLQGSHEHWNPQANFKGTFENVYGSHENRNSQEDVQKFSNSQLIMKYFFKNIQHA